MCKWFIANLDSVISVMAISISFIAVIFTRRNIKTQKFIETITAQRINWIECLRSDLSDIVSGLNMLSFCDTQFKAFDNFVEYEGFEDKETAESAYVFRDNLKVLKNKLDAEFTRIDLVKKIDISILRLNQKDDTILINKLEEIKVYILHEDYEKCIENEFISKFKQQIAQTLKVEWEKVKQEVAK